MIKDIAEILEINLDVARSSERVAILEIVAAALVPLHVAPDAESLPTSDMWAFEGLLTGVRMAVDP